MGGTESAGATGPQVNPGISELTTGSAPASSAWPAADGTFEAVAG